MSDDQSLSEAVVSAVADREGVDPSTLEPPLYEAVDTDALDMLFRSGSGEVSFTYAGYRVTVDDRAEVVLTEQAGGRR